MLLSVCKIDAKWFDSTLHLSMWDRKQKTTADMAVDWARKDIQAAIQHLSEIIPRRCWGSEDFTDHELGLISEVTNKLRDIKSQIERLKK